LLSIGHFGIIFTKRKTHLTDDDFVGNLIKWFGFMPSNTIMLYGKSSIFHTKSRMLLRGFILELNDDWSGFKFLKVIPAAKYTEQSYSII
jgi:hypothetical protein